MLTRAEPDVTANARGDLDASALRIEPTDAARLVALLEGPACSLAELADDALHNLCETCAPDAAGRPRCPACRPARASPPRGPVPPAPPTEPSPPPLSGRRAS